ncbi:LOW QUALITY PROTEIN: kelch-like protein 34 [Poecilia latipinna]|uniref:LOW QUALITY PROTEIN: kelch-like protein 34 n=1 Tax=Poecilia latipinna TaxID=48699 RepID=UPI00072E4224|nr:PREDICTED: LOW QUALITY PROTEIN: kelch-like protein 34 [Poecilia latipinna]
MVSDNSFCRQKRTKTDGNLCMDTYSLLYSSSHRTGLLSGFQRLRDQKKMCDVVLEAGGVSFPCHRSLLASSSDYFWALFGETTTERSADSIRLPALTPEGLEAILDFLYSGWLSISSSTLPVVVEAARYLQVEAALSICERFMADGLTADNCCYYANLAEQHFLLNALEAANQTIAKKMSVLLQKSRVVLLGLNFPSLMAVLDADKIPGVKEVDLIRLSLDWLDENGPLPLLKSNLLLSRLRFGLVAPSELSDLCHGNRAMATPLIRSQLTRALEYHHMGSAQPTAQSRQSTLRGSPNHVLLVGGGVSPDWPEQQVLAFDTCSRKFSSPGFALPLRLRNACVCSVGGFLFVIGGEDMKNSDEKSVTVSTSSQVWRYDPRFNHWKQMESMLERRVQFTFCVVEDVIYAIGGRQSHPNSMTYTSLASVEYYDMASGVWRRAAAMPYPLHGHASTVLDKSIYVTGGLPAHQGRIHVSNQDVNREISSECISWDLKPTVWEKRASMSIPRFGHRLATAHGYIYALLGMYEQFCDIERYDPQSNHWTRLKPLANGLFNYGMLTMAGGNLLVFGGRRWSDGQQVTVRNVLEYDTKKDQWREIAQLPRPLTGTECTLLPLPD